MSPQPISTLKGFGVTFKQIFKKPITQQYPEFKRPVYPRFRGRHRLHLHENGLEKCVGCSLCAAACPSDCIRVIAAENTPENRVSPGERYARIYEINMSRCIFCGYCELACPFDAITLGNEYELSEHNRDDQIYTKDMLLAPPMKQIPVADADLYDTPDPLLQDALVTSLRLRLARVGETMFPPRSPSSRRRVAGGHVRSGESAVSPPRAGAHSTMDRSLARADRCVLGRRRARLDRLGRRRLRVPRVGRGGRLVLEPVLLGARADREPRLARRALPARLGRVRRRGAGARLRGRGDGDVPVRDRVRRPAHGGAVGRRPEPADARRGARGRGAADGDHRRRRARGRRLARHARRRSTRASARRPGSDASSSPTTCSRSRSPRSCCSSRRSAA